MSKSITQDVNVSADGKVDVQQKVHIDGQTIGQQADGGATAGQSVSCSNPSDEFDLEKHLHQQYAATNDANLGILVAFLGTLIGVFAMFGYVFVNSNNAFSKDFGRLIIHCGESTVFHLDVLFLAAAVTLMIISILYRFSLHLGVDQRKEQFLIFAIRLKHYSEDGYKEVFPKKYCPMNKKCIFDIAQGLYGKICKMLISISILIVGATLIKTFVGKCAHCGCTADNTWGNTQSWTIIPSIVVAIISLFAIYCATKKAKCDYQNRVEEYETLYKDCPYKTDGECCKPAGKNICCFCKWFAALALFFFLPFMMSAQVDDWDGSAVQWTHGSGTEADPYLIESAENLAWIAEMVNGGISNYNNVWFKLTKDLNMKDIEWVPIGTSQYFCGKFNGDNHTIDSVSITTSRTCNGLFGITGNGCLIENLHIKIKITNGAYCGGFVGYIKGGTVISNCINGDSFNETRTIFSTIVAGPYNNYHYAGGIVGINEGNAVIQNCKNYVHVWRDYPSSDFDYVYYSGGIIGGASHQCTINRCSNYGRVGVSGLCQDYNNGVTSYSGGICGGCCTNYSSINISMCANTGRIGGDVRSQGGAEQYCGGIFGGGIGSGTLNRYFGCSCTNCYNTGAICAVTSSSISKASSGGICGWSYCSNISNCYNVGAVSGSGIDGCTSADTRGTVANSYYLESCGGTMGGGTSKTEIAMKSASFPVLLNADSVVFMMDLTPNVNGGYPIFCQSVCEVTTQSASSVSFTSAQLNGLYHNQQYWPGGTADVVGFEWKRSTETNYNTVYANVSDSVAYTLNNLQDGVYYKYRFFIQKDGMTYYGKEMNFRTLACDLQASLSMTPAQLCEGSHSTINVESTSAFSNLFTYQWNNGNTEDNILINQAGTYSVIVRDTNGCQSTDTLNVVVNPLPQGIISGNTILCSGQSTTLTGSGANRYNWSTGASTPSISVNESGTYTCTFTNSYNCSSTQSVEVTVFDSPIILGNPSFCTGGSTTLTATGGNSYTWSTGETTPSITVRTAGTYSVTGTSTGGCSGSSSITVVENELPNVAITGTTTICSGIGTLLTATESSSYLWSTGAETRTIR